MPKRSFFTRPSQFITTVDANTQWTGNSNENTQLRFAGTLNGAEFQDGGRIKADKSYALNYNSTILTSAGAFSRFGLRHGFRTFNGVMVDGSAKTMIGRITRVWNGANAFYHWL